MAVEPTPLPYKFTGIYWEYSMPDELGKDNLVTVRVRVMRSGWHEKAEVYVHWLGNPDAPELDPDREGGEREYDDLLPQEPRSWQLLVAYLHLQRPSLNWVRILEPARAALAPSLPPLTLSEFKRKLLTVDDLSALPPPTWIVEGHLPLGAFAVLYGPSGSGKTFLALDLLLSTGAAVRWMGHDVHGGPALYIAAEGIGGLAQRVEAWRDSRGNPDLSCVRFLGQTVNLLDERDVTSLLADIDEMPLPPALIVFDTLARCIPGGDENSARDMGLAVAAIDRVRAATGATCLVVHHTGKNGDTERGSSALRGAADAMLAVTNDDGLIKVQCDKMKDAPEFERMYARLAPYGESAVVGKDAGIALTDPNAPFSRQERAALDVLSAIFGEDGATPTQLEEQARIPRRTLYVVLKTLVTRGVVTKKGTGHAVRYYAKESA